MPYFFCVVWFLLPSYLAFPSCELHAGEEKDRTASRPPNVLFIAIDDLNDWVGCLGGHPQARTPNIDRLAARGTNFTNAHCQAPICNPSRISLLSGKLPSSTGIYYLAPRIREYEGTADLVTLPQHFRASGYHTLGAGKIFHGQNEREFDEYAGTFGASAQRPWPALTTFGQNNHAVRTQNWRYITYADGSEELYDHRTDPYEFRNLASKPKYRKIVAEHRSHLPKTNLPMAPGSSHADARPGSASDIDRAPR